MNNFRRSLLKENGALTLSKTSDTVAGSYISAYYVSVKYNEEDITSQDITISSNESWITSIHWLANYSRFYFIPEQNTSFLNSRTAIITVSYNGAQATFLFTQNAALMLGAGLDDDKLNPNKGSGCFMSIFIDGKAYTGNDYTATSDVSWLKLTKSDSGKLYITAASLNNSLKRTANITITKDNATATRSLILYGMLNIINVRFNDGVTYSSGNWPTTSSGKRPLGIVLPGTSTCVALVNMYDNSGKVCWGGYGYDVASLSNKTYQQALSDMSGKSNTTTILAVDNSHSTSWQTASSNPTNTSSSQYIHPAAQYCWRYSPTGTNKGDWYLPSAGLLYSIWNCWENFDATLRYLQARYKNYMTITLFLMGDNWLSSSEKDSDICWYFTYYDSLGRLGTVKKRMLTHNVRPFMDF